MMYLLRLLTAFAAVTAPAAHAVELTDVWIDPEIAGLRAVLVQHGDRLSLDIHQGMSISGMPHIHAPALETIGLDAHGHRVFAGPLADGQGRASVETFDTDTILIVIDALPAPQRYLLSRASAAPVDLGGRYLGGYSHVGPPCPPFSGRQRQRHGTWTVEYPSDGDVPLIVLQLASPGLSCRFVGQQATAGRLSRVSGEYQCGRGVAGAFEMDGIMRDDALFGGTLYIDVPACGLLRARFGGVQLPGS